MSNVCFIERDVSGGEWVSFDPDEEIIIPRIGEYIRFHKKGTSTPPWFNVIDIRYEVWPDGLTQRIIIYLRRVQSSETKARGVG